MTADILKGLYGVTIPRSYGGEELSLPEVVDTFIDLSYQSLSAAAILGSHVRVAFYLNEFGTEEQKEHYLPKMASSCVVAAHAHTERQSTTARREEDNFIINGYKPIVTNARGANLIAVTTNNHSDIFLIDIPSSGLYVEKEIPRLALKGISLCPIRLDNCILSAKALLGGKEGKGLEYLHRSLGYSLVNYAARGVGIAKSLVDELIENATERDTKTLATLEGYVASAEALTREAARKLEQNSADQKFSFHAKWYSAEVASLVASKVHELIAYHADALSLEQKLVDAQTLKIIGNRSEQVKEKIDSGILK